MAGLANINLAADLLQNGLDPNVLRPWIGKDGKSYRTQFINGEPKTIAANAVASLTKDEWIMLDKTVQQAFTVRIRAAQDLISRGLTYRINNGLGVTQLDTQTVSDMNDATVSLMGLDETYDDRVHFDLASLPLPITHKDFKIPMRALEASRRGNVPLDTTQAAICGRKMAERLEQMIIGDTYPFQLGGGTIYGYTNHPDRGTAAIGDWNATATTGSDILDDVLAMIAVAKAAYVYGPFMLYVGPTTGLTLEEDFKAASDKTIRQRILEVDQIDGVGTLELLGDDEVLLVQMSPETVRLVIGMDPQNVQWETHGGLLLHMKTMQIMVPQIRADFNGHCGIVHGTMESASASA